MTYAAEDSDLVWDDPENAALERQRRDHLRTEAELRSVGLLSLIFGSLLGALLVGKSVVAGLTSADLALMLGPFVAITAGVQLRRLDPTGRLIFAIGGGVAYALYVPFISGVDWAEWFGHISLLSLLIRRLWRPGVETVLSAHYQQHVMRVTPHLEPKASPVVQAAVGLLALAVTFVAGLALVRWIG